LVLARGMSLLPRHAKPVDVLEHGLAINFKPVGWYAIGDAAVTYVIPSGAGLATIDSSPCLVGLIADWVGGCWLALGLVVRGGV
jgi:hypothetical protein